MEILRYYSKFKPLYENLYMDIGLNARTEYLAFVIFHNGFINVISINNTPANAKILKKISDGYLETDFHTFLGMGWGKYSQLQLLWMILTRKVKIRGIITMLKFQKIMKKLNGGKR